MFRNLLLSLTLSLGASELVAQIPDTTFTVYGPRRFERTSGSPVTVVDTFRIPITAEAPCSLFIINGDWDGTDRVSSAVVKVNGILVADQSHFNQQVGSLTRLVVLRLPDTLNTIEVRLSSQPKSFLIIGITATDRTPPRLTVATPPDSHITAEQAIIVSGTVFDETPLTLTVNDDTVSVAPDSSFSTITPLAEGHNTIVVTARDHFGNTSSVTRTVISDMTPPDLIVSHPEEGMITRDTSVTVTGTVSDSTAVALLVQGIEVEPDSAGSYAADLSLVEGSNTITLVATDAAGNSTAVTRLVRLDTTAPTLTVVEPADGFITASHVVTVSGTVFDSTTTTLTVNGIEAGVSPDGSWTIQLQLVEGLNTIVVVATDTVANSTTVALSIVRDSTPPFIVVTSPGDSIAILDSTVVLTGEVRDSTAVALLVNGSPVEIDSPGFFTVELPLFLGENIILIEVTDAAGNVTTETRTVVRIEDVLPPDPAFIAPPLDSTVIAVRFSNAFSFLFSHPTPVQTDVDTTKLTMNCLAVVKGVVTRIDGSPLSGVEVTVADHPEFGRTLSRADGGYDLVVNGGQQHFIS